MADTRLREGTRVSVHDAPAPIEGRGKPIPLVSGLGTVKSFCIHTNEADDAGFPCDGSRCLVELDDGTRCYPIQSEVEVLTGRLAAMILIGKVPVTEGGIRRWPRK